MITLELLVEKLSLTAFTQVDLHKRLVERGYCGDLLSDVMGNAKENSVWMTMQTHKNIIAVASLKDLAAIILVNNNKPDSDTLELANQEEVIVLGTELTAFECAGRIYQVMNYDSNEL